MFPRHSASTPTPSPPLPLLLQLPTLAEAKYLPRSTFDIFEIFSTDQPMEAPPVLFCAKIRKVAGYKHAWEYCTDIILVFAYQLN